MLYENKQILELSSESVFQRFGTLSFEKLIYFFPILWSDVAIEANGSSLVLLNDHFIWKRATNGPENGDASIVWLQSFGIWIGQSSQDLSVHVCLPERARAHPKT